MTREHWTQHVRGHQRRGHMNRTELAYAGVLEARKAVGEVLGYWFEACKLRLADKTFYTPDFLVWAADGTLECHEVKAFWADDARVKIKVAAALYPFRFLAVRRPGKNRGWEVEEI
jgi:hypothetical protein